MLFRADEFRESAHILGCLSCRARARVPCDSRSSHFRGNCDCIAAIYAIQRICPTQQEWKMRRRPLNVDHKKSAQRTTVLPICMLVICWVVLNFRLVFVRKPVICHSNVPGSELCVPWNLFSLPINCVRGFFYSIASVCFCSLHIAFSSASNSSIFLVFFPFGR